MQRPVWSQSPSSNARLVTLSATWKCSSRNTLGFPQRPWPAIFRFQRFYRKWARGQSYDQLKQEIYSYYYDQAHFARDFRKKTGFYPQRFVGEVTNAFGRHLSLQ